MTLKSAVDDLVAYLTAAGIAASADPTTVNPPGVWVQLGSVAHDTLGGGIRTRLALFLIVGDSGTPAALAALSDLYAAVCAVVTPNTDVDTTTTSVQLPDNPTSPLPALQVTVDTYTTL